MDNLPRRRRRRNFILVSSCRSLAAEGFWRYRSSVKAIVFRGVREVAYEEVPDPEASSPGDAIVRVAAAGLCGSDMHPYYGREPGLDLGTVMGHEFVGEVVETGSEVAGFQVGDLVASPFATNCGRCEPCVRGLTARCIRGELFGWIERGSGLHGGQAEYVRVPLAESSLVRVPDGMDAARAVLATDNLPTALWASTTWETAGRPPTTTVLGCGPVGLLAVHCLVRLGVGTVLAVDPVPDRTELAVEFGAADGRRPDEAHGLVRSFGPSGLVIDAAGTKGSTRLAGALVRPGGILTRIGVNTDPHLALSPEEMYDLNLTYGTGRCPARAYMEEAFDILAEGDEPGKVISHRLALSDAPRAYRAFGERRRGWLKVILVP